MLVKCMRICGSRHIILPKRLIAQITSPILPPKKTNSDPAIDLDLEYLCSEPYRLEIQKNIERRKSLGDTKRLHQLYSKLKSTILTAQEETELKKALIEEAKKIPNKSSPAIDNYAVPKVLKEIGQKPQFSFIPKQFNELGTHLNIFRSDNLSNLAGQRGYYLMGDLAELEHALIWFALQKLLENGFQLISVPDILPSQWIERCGMATKGERNQVYRLCQELYDKDLCLSGTAEMALAAFVMNREFSSSELPLKLAAVSRCYRAEISNVTEEKGIYRVHQFTKVEMFAVTSPEESNNFLDYLRDLQEQMYAALGLHLQILDMPSHELGAPAFRKYDIEAWMAGRQLFGEVSSCSNCTDFQSRRLSIKCGSTIGTTYYAHTVNGTACAIPRLLIALFETHQKENGTIVLPTVLQPYMNGKNVIEINKNIPVMKFIKRKAKSKKK